tara:strand:- start:43 stop:3447 length:3405 start_codon:yes stop_codon:yes gene_type:complete
MSSCDELFQERQRLIREKAKNDADLTRIRGIQQSNLPPDDALKKDFSGKFADDMQEIEKSGEIGRNIENASDVDVSIPQGQPTNYVQLLRTNPKGIVEDFALMNKTLQKSGQRLMPEEWKFLNTDVNESAQEVAETLGSDISKENVLGLLERNSDSFNGAVEKLLRVRAMYQVSHRELINKISEVSDFMQRNDIPQAVPNQFLDETFDLYKISLMTERQYDFIRNTWSNMGKAMQGKGYDDLDLDFISKGAAENIDDSIDAPTVQAARDFNPEDFSEESPIARVLAAADLFKSNRKESLIQMEMALGDIRIKGVDYFKHYDPKIWNDKRIRTRNLHAKDWQLFNLRTQLLNVNSNAVLAIFGPARKMYQEATYIPWGTKSMQPYRDVLQAHFEGYGKAIRAIRESYKEVFMDAFQNRSQHFSGAVDHYGKYHEPTDLQLIKLREQRDYKPRTKAGRTKQLLNPLYHTGSSSAALKLWAYEKSGNPYWLRPALNTLSAVDNVSGFFFHNYSVRFDLEMKARKSGVQLGLTDIDGNLSQQKVDDWINNEMKNNFYSNQVTEDMVKRYRKDNGIPPEMMGDVEIEDAIREEFVANTYGAPFMGAAEAQDAARFSEELRFQNKPSDQNLGKKGYDVMMKLKGDSWVADLAFPYMQAPFMGESMDWSWTPFGTLRDVINWEKLNPAEQRRAKSNAIMTGHIMAIYGMLSANGLIVGNGPPEYMFQERAEWLRELEAKGLKPNSIGGVPLIGGIPVISSLFLLEDFRFAAQHALITDRDKYNLLDAIFMTTFGSISRKTALGGVKQLFEVIFPETAAGFGEKMSRYTGWIIGGQMAGSGPAREASRLLNAKRSQVYTERPMTAEETDLFEPGFLEKTERYVRNEIAYNLLPGSPFFGGKFKEKDWLGTKIRLAWGENLGRYMQHRFFPREHPNDKVYAELNRLNLLNPPGPLLTKTLEGVPMSDDLQQLYNQTYSSVVGNQDTALFNIKKKIILTPDLTQRRITKTGSLAGQEVSIKNKERSLKMSIFLAKHVEGKTAIEAFRSLMNDPKYEELQKNRVTTTVQEIVNKEIKEVQKELPYVLMQELKNYYAQLAVNQLNLSDEAAAVKWRERRDLYNAIRQQKRTDDSMAAAELFKDLVK